MFDEVLGLPLHPLIVHATVVALPAAALAALAFVVVPAWRWLLRWPVVVLAVTAPLLTYVTVQAGEALSEERGLARLIADHQEKGEQLLVYVYVFAVLALLGAFVMGGSSALASGRGARRGAAAPLRWAVGLPLVAVCGLVLVQVYLTGSAGARAVWAG